MPERRFDGGSREGFVAAAVLRRASGDRQERVAHPDQISSTFIFEQTDGRLGHKGRRDRRNRTEQQRRLGCCAFVRGLKESGCRKMRVCHSSNSHLSKSGIASATVYGRVKLTRQSGSPPGGRRRLILLMIGALRGTGERGAGIVQPLKANESEVQSTPA